MSKIVIPRIKKGVHIHLDFDGTLVDSIEALNGAYGESVRKFGGSWTRSASELLEAGESASVFLSRCENLDLSENIFKQITDYKNRIYPTFFSLIKTNTRILEFAIMFYPNISVVTNASRSNVLELMDYLQLMKYFSFIVSRDEVRHPKPNPEPYLLSKSKSRCRFHIAIEDSVAGIESASRAGIYVLPAKELIGKDI